MWNLARTLGFDRVVPTPAEVLAPMPGDDLVPQAQVVMDRALEVSAPPDVVWPWLVQLGKERAAMAGAPHHTVLSKAVGVEVLEDFAEMTSTELVVIDADTTPRNFQRELRWNAAYYRLAESL